MTASSSSPSRPSVPAVAAKSASTAQFSQLNVEADKKATTTTSSSKPRPSSQSNVAADGKIASGPRSSSRVAPNVRSRQDAAALDPTSERATLTLIRRTLVADGSHGTDLKASQTTTEGVLPPLTSSNEVDVQLYAIVAIVVKDFVNAWYTRITPDRAFVDEVIQLIAHCTRALEQRLRLIDITELMLDELPVLIERHVAAYRTATTAQAALQYGESTRRIYHALNPHPALDPTLPPEQQRSYESAYRQLLIQGALAVLLPTEDLANTCLRTLVSDIIADLILGQVLAEKVCQPWFLHGIVSKVVEIVTARPTVASSIGTSQTLHQNGRQSRLEQFGLLSSDTADREHNSPTRHQSWLSVWFWSLLQCAFIAYQFLRFLFIGMAYAHRLPQRIRHHESHRVDGSTPSPSTEKSPVASKRRPVGADRYAPRAVISYGMFGCISTLLDLSIRMPWLESSLSFCQYFLSAGPGHLGVPNSTLDKFLYHTLSTRFFSPSLLPPLLLQVRSLVFPNNTLGPAAPPPPSPEEACRIRSKAASDLLSLIPKSVARRFFGAASRGNTTRVPAAGGDDIDIDGGGATAADSDDEVQREVEERILGWTDDVEMNKFVVYAVLEHVVLRLIPEMVGKTPSELLAERGVSLTETSDMDGDVNGHGEKEKRQSDTVK